METQLLSPPTAPSSTSTNQQQNGSLIYLTEQLAAIHAMEMGRPARYYNAYRMYLVCLRITQLEEMLQTATEKDHQTVNNLLMQFQALLEE